MYGAGNEDHPIERGKHESWKETADLDALTQA